MNPAVSPVAIVYSTPRCPDCQALKAWLARTGTAFEERDLTDPTVMADAQTGVRVAPVNRFGDHVIWRVRPGSKPRPRGPGDAEIIPIESPSP